ncbi:TolC family protein [Desulfobacterales bacterium HSG16]|nr:TolC family protein [Desulfobacterales bacterium HSG16]
MGRIYRFICLILSMLVICACQSGHSSIPVVFTPSVFSKTGSKAGKSPARWWTGFQSQELNDLIDTAFTKNFDLESAWARLDQANALAKEAGALKLPSFSTRAGAARTRSNIKISPLSDTTAASYNTQYETSAAAAWEIDLWGRLSSTAQAARLDATAARHALSAIAISLAAEVSETWFSVLGNRQKLKLYFEQLKVNETYLKLVQLRFGQGLVSSLDVYQQRQRVAATRSLIPLTQARIKAGVNRLGLLTGFSVLPENLKNSKTDVFPDIPQLPNIGLPADLLNNRPDVTAALMAIKSADLKAFAAVCERFPSLQISASSGYRASNLSNLFENLIWDIIGNVSQILWDGGKRSAKIARHKAIVKEKMADYAKTVLVAFYEVEDAIMWEDRQQVYLERLDSQIKYAKMTLNEARLRYLNGLSDYLPVLTSLTSLQQLEQNRIDAKKNLLSRRIQLHRALAGTWTENLKRTSAK